MAVKTVASAPCLLVEDSSSMLDPQRRQVVGGGAGIQVGRRMGEKGLRGIQKLSFLKWVLHW